MDFDITTVNLIKTIIAYGCGFLSGFAVAVEIIKRANGESN